MKQEALQELWHSCAPGRLTPWQQSMALALREASKEIYNGYVCLSWISSKLQKTDSSGKSYLRGEKSHPAHSSVKEFFEKVDADRHWFPGKHSGTKRGPEPVLTAQKRSRIAASAMSQKAEGHEPDAAVTIVRCPVATLNPNTQRPFCEKTIRKVFLEDCYDFDPDFPWKLQRPLQKMFLPDDIKDHRLTMSRYILEHTLHGEDPSWWLRNVVWIDPCASILPRSRKQYDKMRRAELRDRKRLISDDAREYSRNLKGPRESLKQASWDAERVSWMVVLARGKVAMQILPEDWTLTAEGMVAAIKGLTSTLRRMLGANGRLPRTLFTDRGTGMYIPAGQACSAFAEAVADEGFRLYWGADAVRQSPDMGDMLLHETAVSWIRARLRREKPEVHPWLESREQWSARAQRVLRNINMEYDVDGLCRAFPARLHNCVEGLGERLRT